MLLFVAAAPALALVIFVVRSILLILFETEMGRYEVAYPYSLLRLSLELVV